MVRHELRLVHRRDPMTVRIGDHASQSSVEVDAESSDLTEAWRELLSRIPSDVYAALKEAMGIPEARGG